MKYEFDVPCEKVKRKSIYDKEYNLIKELVNGSSNTLRFEYENEDIAKSAYGVIRKKTVKEGLTVKVMKAKNFVFILKEQEGGKMKK